MAKKLDPKKTVTFKDFLITNAIQIDALTQLLIEKDLITDRGRIFHQTAIRSS